MEDTLSGPTSLDVRDHVMEGDKSVGGCVKTLSRNMAGKIVQDLALRQKCSRATRSRAQSMAVTASGLDSRRALALAVEACSYEEEVVSVHPPPTEDGIVALWVRVLRLLNAILKIAQVRL